ncbi:MAG: hypothetical protein WA021_00835, partial [Minisyncoccia bacterium]
MVMGNDKIGKLLTSHGASVVHGRYDQRLMTTFFAEIFDGDTDMATFSVELFERLAEAAPIPIDTNMAFLWWANFALKWQACYYFILLFVPTRDVHKISREHLAIHFISFFNTDEFQLWSMNNLDKRIKDTWKSYKWVLKDIIYDYTKDAEYRDHKTKKGSLLPLLGYDPPHHFIDENMQFHRDLAPEEYLRPDNSFV